MDSQKKFTMEFLKLMEIEKFISLLQNKKEFYDHICTERRLSNNTVLSYKSDIDLFEKFIAKNNFKDLTVETVVRKYITNKSVMGMSGRTNNRFISSLKKFLKFFLKDKYINFINVKSPKFTNKLPNILNVEEVERLLNFKPSQFEDYLDKVILEVLYSSGLRVSELINLKNKDIDFEEEMVKVIGKGQKERIIPIGSKALDSIKRYIEVKPRECNDSHIFLVNKKCKNVNIRYVQRMIKKRCLMAEIHKDITPHTLRHSFASHILQSSGNLRVVQELLGHSNISTTQIYTHLDWQNLAKTYDKTHPRAKIKQNKL